MELQTDRRTVQFTPQEQSCYGLPEVLSVGEAYVAAGGLIGRGGRAKELSRRVWLNKVDDPRREIAAGYDAGIFGRGLLAVCERALEPRGEQTSTIVVESDLQPEIVIPDLETAGVVR